jgi:hypothetical protein
VIPAGTLAGPPALSTIFWLFSSRHLTKSKTNVRRPDQYRSLRCHWREIPFDFADRVTSTCAQTLVSVKCPVFQSRGSSLRRGLMPESY